MSRTVAAQSLRGLLNRPETRERFHERIAQLEALRTVDAGVPRREESEKRLHRSFRSLRHRIADQGLKFKKGDSAVLVPLVELSADRQPWALFTRRSFHLRTHRGEVSFPGGRIDEGETPDQTALREAHEEIGLHADDVDVWGRMPPLLTHHNRNIVTPVVATVAEEALTRLIVGAEEVQLIFIAPLFELSKSESYTAFRVGAHLYRMPIFHTHDFRLLMTAENTPETALHVDRIWGLSAGILSELLGVLLEDGPKDE